LNPNEMSRNGNNNCSNHLGWEDTSIQEQWFFSSLP
jgi:hypothetical protein